VVEGFAEGTTVGSVVGAGVGGTTVRVKVIHGLTRASRALDE
jgi:hypothetical protein